MTQDTAIIRINPALAFQKPLEDYIQYLEKISLRSLPLLGKLAEPGMHYADPVHDVRGVDDVIDVFRRRLADVKNPKFRIKDCAWGQDKQTVYLRWTYSCMREGNEEVVQGMAEVMFSNNGLVMSHEDFVDTVYKEPPPPTLWRKIKNRYF